MPPKKNEHVGTPSMSEMNSALEVLNKMIEQANTYNKQRMDEYGLTKDFCDYVGTMSEEEIDTLTLPQINSYLSQYGIDSGTILQKFSKGDNSVSTLDKWKDFFAELRVAVRDMDESLTTREELQQACQEVYDAQTDFIKSSEYKEAYASKIEKVRELAENEPDPILRKKYIGKLDAIQKSSDLTFLLARLDDPKINKKNPNAELNRLVEIFFDKNRSQFLMERYLNNARKMHLSPNYHVNLYDIEEKFLPETFYPLNNFFLFVVMSYIAYLNMDDEVERLYATTILAMMGNLLMEELDEDETGVLLGVIRNIENRILVLDNVMDKFRRDNTTWKEHPVRKDLEAKRAEMKYRLELIDEVKFLLNGFGANLVDGTKLTAKNASAVLRKMSTEQIESIRDDVKAEAERHQAELEDVSAEKGGDEDDNNTDDGESTHDAETTSDDANTEENGTTKESDDQ